MNLEQYQELMIQMCHIIIQQNIIIREQEAIINNLTIEPEIDNLEYYFGSVELYQKDDYDFSYDCNIDFSQPFCYTLSTHQIN